ncbi:hypothetical protein NNO_1566 [Hydrogenimonas sp.]|nr:hypothetical protein NNO_1566 [Hydrogenimonas sp.]
MKLWIALLLPILLFTGCNEKTEKGKEFAFSVLIPQPAAGQSVHYIHGKQVFTSLSGDSAVSAMVINNPIMAGREAILAIAIENRTDGTIELKWDDITFFNPKNYIKLLPVSEIEEYFKKPNRCKPMLNAKAFRRELEKYGVFHDPALDTQKRELFPSEAALLDIFKEIKEDLCYTRLPNNTTLEQHKVTVGYMVILLPAENFERRMLFMLKIPAAGTLHKLRYALQPLQ